MTKSSKPFVTPSTWWARLSFTDGRRMERTPRITGSENLEEQEYRILYDNNNEPFFMTIAELLAEVIGMNDTHN